MIPFSRQKRKPINLSTMEGIFLWEKYEKTYDEKFKKKAVDLYLKEPIPTYTAITDQRKRWIYI